MRYLAHITLFLALAVSAYACRCGEKPSVANAAGSAEVIFVGRAMKLTIAYRKVAGTDGYREVIECEFSVSEAIKGIDSAKERVSILTSSEPSACGYPFRIGEEYLVYGRKEQKEFETSVCMRTRPRLIIDEKQGFSDLSKIKGDDAMLTEVPLIRKVFNRK